MRNCFPAFIFCVIQATSKSDRKLVFALQFFARHHGISSCREHRQLSRAPPVVRGTYSCRKHPQLSGVSKEPTVVWTTYSCREHLKFVESTSSYPKYSQLSRAPPVVQRPPVVESTSSCPKYLQLSRAPPVVQSTSSCREHLQLSKVSPVIENISSCREYLHLSKVPPVVESDFCQTGSVIHFTATPSPSTTPFLPPPPPPPLKILIIHQAGSLNFTSRVMVWVSRQSSLYFKMWVKNTGLDQCP